MRDRVARGSIVVGGTALFPPVSGCDAPITAPKGYKEFVSKDGSFTCRYPDGW